MSRSAPFSPAALRAWDELSLSSARVVLPLVFALRRPASVIDVGCLYGSWAAVCRELGVEDVVGIDGDYVDRRALRIPERSFVAHDLAESLKPTRTFDLAVSLEVAHYLPESRAAGFVADLCALAPVVLFSAAIPCQGGRGHVNEQWPAYWAERFASQRYTPVDCVRDEVWDNATIASWYAQNTLLFVSHDACYPAINDHCGFGRSPARVHPDVFMTYAGGRYHRLRARVADLLATLARLPTPGWPK